MKKTINYFVAAGLAAALLTVGACSKKDTTLPAIGGFNSSADIETSNLVAFWSFENTFGESIQNLTPSVSPTAPTFVAGVKGQAYQGGGDTYVSYPLGTLGSVQSLTVSLWYKETADPINNTSGANGGTAHYIAGQGDQGILHMWDASGDFYVLEIELEQTGNNKIATNDSLRFHMGFKTATTGEYGPEEGVVPEVYLTNTLTKWTHLVMTYDQTTSNMTVYKNGAIQSLGSAWSKETDPGASVQILNGGSSVAAGGDGKGTPLGPLALDSPLGLILGAFPHRLNLTADNLGSSDYGGNWQGALDEIRIYKVGLSQAEVGALYQLELAGR